MLTLVISCYDSCFLGSVDLQNAIQSTIPNNDNFRCVLPPPTSPEYHTLVESNNQLAERAVARVLILYLTIQISKCIFLSVDATIDVGLVAVEEVRLGQVA